MAKNLEVNIQHKYAIINEIIATSNFKIRNIEAVDIIIDEQLGKCYKIIFKDQREVLLPIEEFPMTEVNCFMNKLKKEEIFPINERLHCVIEDVEEYIQHNNLEKDEELNFVVNQLSEIQEIIRNKGEKKSE